MSYRYNGLEGKAMINAYHERGFFSKLFTKAKWNHVTWPASEVANLLSQPGVVRFRIHRAYDGKKEVLVMCGVCSEGLDMMTAEHFVIENGVQCPPICPGKPQV